MTSRSGKLGVASGFERFSVSIRGTGPPRCFASAAWDGELGVGVSGSATSSFGAERSTATCWKMSKRSEKLGHFLVF